MKLTIILVLISFGYCKCLELAKCSIYDSKCQKKYFQYVGRTQATIGRKEIGIPVIEPFQNPVVSLFIFGLFNITLTEGKTEGISRCLVTEYELNVGGRYKIIGLICDKIIIRGRYKFSSSLILKNTYADFHGTGNGTITLVNWYFRFRYPIEIVKKANGQIYVEGLFDKAVYESRVGQVIVQANGIKKGKCDISKSATCFINSNWRILMASDIGKFINDKSAQYYYDVYDLFFKYVPASQYLSDDLSNLVDRVD